MILLPTDVALPDETLGLLNSYQTEVDSAGDYEQQVSEAKRLFSLRNKSTNKCFSVVRTVLNELCGGAGRCCYCELSQPDEIEHIRPKDLFPECVFVWENYVYSCGPCNGPKNNQFAIFRKGSDKPTVISRQRDDPITRPPRGDPVLIDPRSENPLDFMELDLFDTFQFVPTFDEGTREFGRADYTIKVLRLNERDVLIKARRNAFVAFRAILKEIADLKYHDFKSNDLKARIRAIRESPHPAVWQEMKRQRDDHSDLKKLFELVPEADAW